MDGRRDTTTEAVLGATPYATQALLARAHPFSLYADA